MTKSIRYFFHRSRKPSLNLGDLREVLIPKKGRWEYGPGLYVCSEHSAISESYGRYSYIIGVEEGVDVRSVNVPVDGILEQLKCILMSTKLRTGELKAFRQELMESASRRQSGDNVPLSVALNLILNDSMVLAKNAPVLNAILVNNGADYYENFFNGYPMLAVFNRQKIISVTRMQNDFFSSESSLADSLGYKHGYGFPRVFVSK